MALTTAGFRDHGVDLAIPTLPRGRTIEGFCVGSTSRAPNLKRDCAAQQTTSGGAILYAEGRCTNAHRRPFPPEGLLRFCSPIRARRWGSWEWRITDRAAMAQQSQVEGCGQVSGISFLRGSVRPAYFSIPAPIPVHARCRSQAPRAGWQCHTTPRWISIVRTRKLGAR